MHVHIWLLCHRFLALSGLEVSYDASQILFHIQPSLNFMHHGILDLEYFVICIMDSQRNIFPHRISMGDKSNALILHASYKMSTFPIICGPQVLISLAFFFTPSLKLKSQLLVFSQHYHYHRLLLQYCVHYRQVGDTSFGEERRTWEIQMKEGVLYFLSCFDSFGFHGRIEGVNI